jgi:hypothetical protein
MGEVWMHWIGGPHYEAGEPEKFSSYEEAHGEFVRRNTLPDVIGVRAAIWIGVPEGTRRGWPHYIIDVNEEGEIEVETQ